MPTEVAILFADLTNSHEFAVVETPERYNEVIRGFQMLAHQVVERFKDKNHTGDRLYAEMVNDNLLTIISGDSATVDILNLSLALKRSWNESELVAELRRFHQSPSFPVTMDMSIGLSQEPVKFDPNSGLYVLYPVLNFPQTTVAA